MSATAPAAPLPTLASRGGVGGRIVLATLFTGLAAAAAIAPSPGGAAGSLLPAAGSALRFGAWCALALAAFATATTLKATLGGLAPWNVAVVVFASATWAMVLWQPIPVLVASAVALAYAVMLYVPTAPPPDVAGAAGEPQLYGGGVEEDAPAVSLVRWLLAGALLGVPAVWHPAFLCLLLGGVAATPLLGRRRAAAALLVGALLLIGPGVGLTGGLARWAADLHLPAFDLHLLGWNLAWCMVGRQAGGLIYFFPLAIFLFADLGDRFTLAVLGSIGLSLVALVLLRPFDWLLAPTLLAAPSFLPLYVPLWFLPGRSVRPRVLLGLAIPALALSWPLLRAPLAPPVGADGAARYVASWLARLPVEATQRNLPGVRDAQSGALRLRLLDGAAWTESVGELRMQGNRPIELLLISVDELPAVSIEFGAHAPPRLTVDGATIGDTAFRPDGRVGFELRLASPAATVPMWWTPSRQCIYRLTLRLEGGPAEPVAFTLKAGPLRRSTS